MKLQTIVPLHSEKERIDYASTLFLIGSCFVENIGKKFQYYQFQTLQNPLGILFHPEAIENFIVRSVEQKKYKATDVFNFNERWHCFDAHSDLSDPSKDKLLANLNGALHNTRNQLENATHVIITLGTAWVYRNIESQKRVANCHKVPQKKFTKELLSKEEIEESLNQIIANIRKVNENASVIFTISPVRHLKDGFVENQRSKAKLISAVGKIMQVTSNNRNLHYFPAFEIMLDELRDYRFYVEDMVHPNNLAIDYIWEKFKNVWVAEKAESVMKAVEEIQKGLSHRPFNEDSDQHQLFLKSLNEKISALNKEFPFMKFKP
ncbi:GSCFA domain-containing protein [uncultured Eudoraea sp.]|uniref:GSCFA domain-containing protein n=1 Tax=uncultured Eudoraea sp. TaxID=1035614 RepID=UPI00262073EA|nr:GSCFA domain-containing protein [uncultured Eudoraea sp.]